MKNPAYVQFVDRTAAFDHVVRKWLFKSINQRFPPGADRKLVELIEALYTYTTTSLAETPDDVFIGTWCETRWTGISSTLQLVYGLCNACYYEGLRGEKHQVHETELPHTIDSNN